MDADLSHPPERVPALVDALAEADVAVGSRYVAGGAISNWSWSRRLISWLGNWYVRLVLGLPVRDATAGFKAFRADALRTIGVVDSLSNGYCFQVENTWRAVRLGLVVVEVPITFTDRAAGSSKMSGRIVLEAVVRVLRWRATDTVTPWNRRTPVARPSVMGRRLRAAILTLGCALALAGCGSAATVDDNGPRLATALAGRGCAGDRVTFPSARTVGAVDLDGDGRADAVG